MSKITKVSGGEPPTADSVKSKLQSLLTASNAKTGKSDTNLTDAVNTLIEGYGQGGGGGGECTKPHIIEVDTLPEVGEEGEYYSINKFIDVVMVMGGMAMPVEFGSNGAYLFIATSETYQDGLPDGCAMAACYLTDVPAVYAYDVSSGWEPFPSMFGEFKGEIASTGDADTTTDGYYALVNASLHQYTNGKYKMFVPKGGVIFRSNGDGTCQTVGLEEYHPKMIEIPSTSPNGDIVTNVYGFRGEFIETVIIPNTVTHIWQYAFEDCITLKSVTIPESVTNIGMYAFWACQNLTTINYNGTIAQWDNIVKDPTWKNDAPISKVICADGEVTL